MDYRNRLTSEIDGYYDKTNIENPDRLMERVQTFSAEMDHCGIGDYIRTRLQSEAVVWDLCSGAGACGMAIEHIAKDSGKTVELISVDGDPAVKNLMDGRRSPDNGNSRHIHQGIDEFLGAQQSRPDLIVAGRVGPEVFMYLLIHFANFDYIKKKPPAIMITTDSQPTDKQSLEMLMKEYDSSIWEVKLVEFPYLTISLIPKTNPWFSGNSRLYI